ncbi:DUF732 domain-containing protein [Mycolicibacterium septicum]|uniref:DUF732 domain-containing protein n=1 Tax=Mycolicibacterium septicum TaxID=98668 RepID=UPI001AF94093|nr:DUF732 domain-containing protein [Mycolicibacterium septicum]QRY51760.1 DUF732 domain-containing protein [Mycolicibacterium septicum]
MKVFIAVAFALLMLAPQAHADDTGFIEAIHSLDHFTASDQDILATGERVCDALDRGEHAPSVVRQAFPDSDEFAGYYAVRFAEYATYELCPQHHGEDL